MIIIAGTVLSFVVFFSPDADWNPSTEVSGDYVSPTSGKTVPMFGQPVSRTEFEQSYKETMLFYFIRSGKWPDTDENAKRRLEADTLYRLLLVKRAEDLEIHVTPEAVAKMTLRRIGNYPYGKFVQDVLRPVGLTSADFERFALHETMIQQLAAVITAPAGLVLPKEAEQFFRKDHQEAATQVVPFWATNFFSQVDATPEAVRSYFTNRQAFYRVPPRVEAHYVEFFATNYLAEADKQLTLRTNLPALIEEEYFRRGTNSFTNATGEVLSETDGKARLREDIREQFGLVEARKKASEFGTILYEAEDPNQVTNFLQAAAADNLEVKSTPPFSHNEGLDEEAFPPDFRTTALKLTRAKPIHFLPIVGEKSVFVLALKTNLPSEMPPFEQVEEKVTLDFKRDKAMQMAIAAGTNFQAFLTNGLAQDKKFAELCAEKNVTPLAIPPFSDATRSLTNVDERINLRLLQQYTADMNKGDVTTFIRTAEGGMIVYLEDRLPVSEAKVQTELPDYINTMRTARFNDAFNAWLRKQVELAQLVIPQPEAVTPATPPRMPQPQPQ